MSTSNGQPIRVGIAGLGRSGWNIHARTLEGLPKLYQVAAVSDPDAKRREEAKAQFGCRTHDSFESLIADKELDLIVVASPSHMHVDHAIAAMQAGLDVVVEKPFALSSEEADRAIQAAEQTGRVVAPFQQRRFDPAFQKVQEVIASGKLGRIVQIRMAVHGFKRRWDWQTLKKFGGGTLNNTGPHFLDQALELFGPGEPEVFALMDQTVSLGDADDHVKLILHGEGHPIVEVEMTSASPYKQDLWHIMGTQGGLKGGGTELEWTWINPDELPERTVETEPTPDRSYNREEYTWHSDSWSAEDQEITPLQVQFYENVYRTLRENASLVITPESVRRQIAVIEQCHEMSPV